MKAGDRIRFTKTLVGKSTEWLPSFNYVEKGELGTIHSMNQCKEGAMVKADNWPLPIAATEDEYEEAGS